VRFANGEAPLLAFRKTLVAIKLFSGVNSMTAKTADEWCDSMIIIDDERRKFFRGCWGAATKAAEEKFNSALRQPTNQGREPTEIAPPVTCECCHEQPAVMNVCHDCYMAT
jgi:hypothetical protein